MGPHAETPNFGRIPCRGLRPLLFNGSVRTAQGVVLAAQRPQFVIQTKKPVAKP